MTMLFPELERTSGAWFSPCERYRYTLWRRWDDGPTVNFLCLNPSTATPEKNDPTCERLERRARSMDFGGLIVTNLFALRSTDPAGLRTDSNPTGGPDNDYAIIESATNSERTVCAWGVHGEYLDRSEAVLRILVRAGLTDKLYCLKIGKTGAPSHPLYISYDVLPVPFPCGF